MATDRLTKQDMKFVKGIVEHGNQTEAAKEAYNIKTDPYAWKKGSLKVREGKIQDAIQALADKIDNNKLERVINEGLDATRKQFRNNVSTGEIEEVAVEPDHAIRHKFLDTSLKLKGAYSDEARTNNIIMPVLVKFIDKDEASDNGDTSRIQETI